MDKDKIEKFEKLHIQIKDMYKELSVLSKNLLREQLTNLS